MFRLRDNLELSPPDFLDLLFFPNNNTHQTHPDIFLLCQMFTDTPACLSLDSSVTKVS